jgi:hypothetical protein
MKKQLNVTLSTLSLLTFCCHTLSALSVTREQTKTIAHKIWHNECGGTLTGLTTWNHGETCASLGIGHFIWYPTKKSDRFHETFPELLLFLQEQGAKLPLWLANNRTCPWATRTAFYENIQSKDMQELRTLLAATINDQALFMAKRLENILPSLIKKCTQEERQHITQLFNELASTSQGLYALIDYLNFKGAGTGNKESYHHKGWGLKQVLLATKNTPNNQVTSFSDAAKRTLTQRVQLAPKERKENRWLTGWIKRIDTYTQS